MRGSRASPSTTQAGERGNLEGAAVFALLAPRARRAEVVRAAVAFQALYDFLDTLAELPAEDPVANGRTLHRALLAALDPARRNECYLQHSGFTADGGYVEELIAACRGALAELPSYDCVAQATAQAAARMVSYQSLNHDSEDGERRALREWAGALTPAGSGLRWWETAAGAASSLGVFALIAAAADPRLSAAEVSASAEAYFPWVGALHVLLDSLVDLNADLRSGDHSLVSHYGGSSQAAERLGRIAGEAAERLEGLARKSEHGLILTAMASFYIARPSAHTPEAAPASAGVRRALGSQARPAVAVLRARSALVPVT